MPGHDVSSIPAYSFITTVPLLAAGAWDIQNIPQTFSHLRIMGTCRGDTVAATVAVQIRFNNDSGSNYDYQYLAGVNATASSNGANAQTSISSIDGVAASGAANFATSFSLDIPNYIGTTFYKSLVIYGSCTSDTAATGRRIEAASGVWRSTSAINRIAIFPATGNWIAGSSLSMYGLL